MIERSLVDGQHIEIHTIDGVRYRLLGYVMKDGVPSCPTDKCGAYCCKVGAIFPDMEPPCKYLNTNLNCYFQERGGYAAKPLGCTEYPRSQEDIDRMNRDAVGEERCLLRFEVA